MRLYDTDFVQWSEETARAITEERWSDIDREALADEVESLGKRDRREIVSRLEVLLQHLLKNKYQPDKQTVSAKGAQMCAAKPGRKSSDFRAARLTPRPFCACSSSAKGAAARRQTAEELARLSGGALDTAPVLRVFLKNWLQTINE